MNVAVAGTGYVGLVVGACLAEAGNDVCCADLDEQTITQLNEGVVPIYEPGLEEIVRRNRTLGRLRFTSVGAAVRPAEVAIIAVETPSDEAGAIDVSQVLAVAEAIGRAMDRELVVAVKSTVPVGTSEQLAQIIAPLAPWPFHMCSNPEFLKEGSARRAPWQGSQNVKTFKGALFDGRGMMIVVCR